MSNVEAMRDVCSDYVAACSRLPELGRKPKTHLVLHLVDSMIDFGPAPGFCTERYFFPDKVYNALF